MLARRGNSKNSDANASDACSPVFARNFGSAVMLDAIRAAFEPGMDRSSSKG